jgi:N6-L-threonylcarbamoyladenine synthase
VINKIISVETSCDDTSVAIVDHHGFVIDQVTASQDLQHTPYGGVVPEIASRNHSISLLPLIDTILKKNNMTFDNIDGFTVTNRPGLIGSLIVGLMTIKALSESLNKPYIGVNHLEGHLLAPFLKDAQYAPPQDFDYPYVALAVSGGHSSLYWVKGLSDYTIIGTTKDDAAGEAFDKFAKMVGLGYPGGVLVDRMAQNGDSKKYSFPRSLILEKNLMMSFSGLKSSAHRLITSLEPETLEKDKADLCASFQEAVVDVLIHKLVYAAQVYGTKKMVITGGVSANSRLRARCEELKNKGYQVVIPPLRYCTDNAAMIGYTGIQYLNRNEKSEYSLGPMSTSKETDFKIDLYQEPEKPKKSKKEKKI